MIRYLFGLLVCRLLGHRWGWCRTRRTWRSRVLHTSMEYRGCVRCGRASRFSEDMSRYARSGRRGISHRL